MKNKTTTQISDLVESFVSDLEQAVHETALNLVRQALGDAPATPSRRSASKPRKAQGINGSSAGKKTRKRLRRNEDELAETAEVILDHVRDNPGERLEHIGAALDRPTKGLKRPIANMIADGMLRTEGQRRGTKYFTTRKSKTKAKAKAGKADEQEE